jgi:hypothetical protein
VVVYDRRLKLFRLFPPPPPAAAAAAAAAAISSTLSSSIGSKNLFSHFEKKFSIKKTTVTKK